MEPHRCSEKASCKNQVIHPENHLSFTPFCFLLFTAFFRLFFLRAVKMDKVIKTWQMNIHF
ncbi:hypothetical protein CHCC20333_2556 [Bacillus paralicheniformis]|nr:hypothetical protein CHCC20333_2556 [Bacillus paralicheniformis]